MTELNPCRIDGGAPIAGEHIENGTTVMAYVKCVNCDAKVIAETEEAAAELWNAEAAPEPPIPPEPPEPEADTIRFDPGHYMACDMGSGSGGVDAPGTGWVDQIKSLKPYEHWRGSSTLVEWGDIESTRGVYNWPLLEKLHDANKGIDKSWMLGIMYQWFGGPTGTKGKIPGYLDTIIDGTPGYSLKKAGETWNGNLTLYVWLHDPRVMTPFIEMCVAVVNHFKDSETLIMLSLGGETAVDAPASSGFTNAKLKIQIKRWLTTLRSATKTLELLIPINYLGSDADMNEVIEHDTVNAAAQGGPDNYTRAYQANVLLNGGRGGNDRRGLTSWVSENQRPATSSGGTSATTRTVFDWNWNFGNEAKGGSMRPHYWKWNRNGNSAGGAETWPTIRDTIQGLQGKCNTNNPYTSLARKQWMDARSKKKTQQTQQKAKLHHGGVLLILPRDGGETLRIALQELFGK